MEQGVDRANLLSSSFKSWAGQAWACDKFLWISEAQAFRTYVLQLPIFLKA